MEPLLTRTIELGQGRVVRETRADDAPETTAAGRPA
jgi:hypothetical protein